MDTRAGGGVGEPGTERAHRAVLGREGLGEARHVPPQGLLPLHQVDLDPGAGKLLGRGEPTDAPPTTSAEWCRKVRAGSSGRCDAARATAAASTVSALR